MLIPFFVTQKKLIRIMSHNSRFAHTDPLFCKYVLLKLPDILSLQTCLFVYKALHIFSIDCGLQLISQNVNTRRSMNLRIPLCLRGAVVSASSYESAGPGSILAGAVGAKLTQLSILPFGLVGKWVPGETWGR